uniref:Uncharacterized protein n=1 Tax=Nelumbo nucifera TaxID=4432 RepID=A0A822YST7_NELNU|nr:TPA_asm: hypothetical protein HUJ06_006191 [Nelumbo nucifera]
MLVKEGQQEQLPVGREEEEDEDLNCWKFPKQNSISILLFLPTELNHQVPCFCCI